MFTKSRTRYILVLISLFSILVFNSLAQESDEEDHDDPPHWTYEGEEGPGHWGDLSPEYILCLDGTAQSPIDISDATELDLVDISFDYAETALNIFNNGHTIQVNTDEGSSISYNSIGYDVLQFHFHHPSEHSINGELADMEIHFVHRDPNSGNLAVVGILLMAGEEENEAYASIFDNLPSEKGEPEANDMAVTLISLLPEEQTFYTYQGSLTTPPCSEIVRWLLLDTPIYLSEAQIESFAAIFEMNARHAQDLNDRDLLHDNN